MTHIFIFHIGCQDYVRLCLNQCLKYGNNVILLNDNPNNFRDLISDKCNIVDYRNYFTNANIFQKMYKHFSTNNIQLEFICIIRWMCIYEYMKKHRIIRGFIMDSDVLVYDNIKEIDEKYLKDKELMLCSSSSKNLSGSASIFNFMKLREFIGFIFEFYSDENIKLIENWWKNYKEPGGIQATRKKEDSRRNANYLVKTYPDLVKINNNRNSGFVEIRLRDSSLSKKNKKNNKSKKKKRIIKSIKLKSKKI